MDKQAWSRRAFIASAAVVLAAAMPLTMEAQPFGQPIGPGSRVATGADEGSIIEQANPADDGSIIIECRVGFGGRTMPIGNGGDSGSTLQRVSMPQRPLGPSQCRSGTHNEDGGGSSLGDLMTVF